MTIEKLSENKYEEELVSVIIPCYNTEKFVEKAVRSIMQQTYKNLEIIVINDCSTDSTGLILKKLARIDKRIIYIENETNLRLPKTLNKALSYCSGEYISRMDADDISMPNRIELQIQFLLNNPDIDIVGSNTQCINEDDEILNNISNRPILNEVIIKQLPYKVIFSHPTITAKKSFFEDTQGYRIIDYAEDYDCWIRGMLIGKKFSNLPQCLVNYRVHDSQLTNNFGYNPKNEKVVRKILIDNFFNTLNPSFLLGVALHTKIANKFFSIRSKLEN